MGFHDSSFFGKVTYKYIRLLFLCKRGMIWKGGLLREIRTNTKEDRNHDCNGCEDRQFLCI